MENQRFQGRLQYSQVLIGRFFMSCLRSQAWGTCNWALLRQFYSSFVGSLADLMNRGCFYRSVKGSDSYMKLFSFSQLYLFFFLFAFALRKLFLSPSSSLLNISPFIFSSRILWFTFCNRSLVTQHSSLNILISQANFSHFSILSFSLSKFQYLFLASSSQSAILCMTLIKAFRYALSVAFFYISSTWSRSLIIACISSYISFMRFYFIT